MGWDGDMVSQLVVVTTSVALVQHELRSDWSDVIN